MIQHFTGTYYDILEVKTEAPQNEITRAYERAKITYSATNPALYTVFSVDEARELVQVIEEAYIILGNATYRTRYDELLNDPQIKAEDLNYNTIVGTPYISTNDKQRAYYKSEYQKSEDIEAQINSATVWDGPMLKKVREYKNIPIEKLSEITRINQYYIQCIEKNDWKNLPVAVFIRGFIVQIARVLLLDEKRVVDSFMNVYKSQVGKNT
jgi:curved DNA-binding protein CbpA